MELKRQNGRALNNGFKNNGQENRVPAIGRDKTMSPVSDVKIDGEDLREETF